MIITLQLCSQHGWTALMWASDRGNTKIVDLLLNKGADPNMTSKVFIVHLGGGVTLAETIIFV